MKTAVKEPRERILEVARTVFAHNGYAGASVQEIVDRAGLAKPTLYYYFGNKAGLFQALVDHVADERLELMQRAIARQRLLVNRLTALIEALLRYAREKQDLMRIMFLTWFAAPGEIPREINFKKGIRNFEFIHSLIKEGLRSGELNSNFTSWEIASSLAGQIFLHSTAQLARQKRRYRKVLPKTIAKLFLHGAAAPKPLKKGGIA